MDTRVHKLVHHALINTDSKHFKIFRSDGSCDNSGDELVRRAIALQGRSEAANLYNKRHFLLEDGQDILVFERKAQPASLDKLVGTQTYLAHEDRSVKIVKAL